MYCVFCGAENPEFASFCEKCGKSTNWKQNQSSTGTEASDVPTETEDHGSTPSQFVPAEKQKRTRDAIGDTNAGDFQKTYSETTSEELPRHEKDVPSSRQYRGLWILAWFVALLIFNVWSHWSQNGDKNALYTFLEALGQLTTPLELLLSAAVVGGILSRRKAKTRDGEAQTLKKQVFSKRTYIVAGTLALVVVIGLVVASLPKGGTKQLDNQAGQSRPQDEKAAVNPNALDSYEVMSKSKADLGTEADGLTPEAKKRMREMLALQLAGGMQQQHNPTHIEVTGDNHDVLLFQLSSMNDAMSNYMIQTWREGDANFWNGMRLMNYNQVIFSGDGYKKIVTREEFLSYGKDYEKYKAAFLKATKGIQAGAQGELTKP